MGSTSFCGSRVQSVVSAPTTAAAVTREDLCLVFFVVVKEREMEIGYPTDVKHVAHIGWDGPSGNGPGWMNEFKTAPDFSTSLGNLRERRNYNSVSMASSSTQDFEDIPSSNQLPDVPKKQKKKKIKSTTSSSSSRKPKAAIATATFNERGATPIIKV